ncbi:hypothetical protein, partial [Rhodococcus erythropolis]|uniref:hypothetical protein n=1 Tax=Rhodococcus erythropolis TaxID=1833 RepID=UPI001C4068DE
PKHEHPAGPRRHPTHPQQPPKAHGITPVQTLNRETARHGKEEQLRKNFSLKQRGCAAPLGDKKHLDREPELLGSKNGILRATISMANTRDAEILTTLGAASYRSHFSSVWTRQGLDDYVTTEYARDRIRRELTGIST